MAFVGCGSSCRRCLSRFASIWRWPSSMWSVGVRPSSPRCLRLTVCAQVRAVRRGLAGFFQGGKLMEQQPRANNVRPGLEDQGHDFGGIVGGLVGAGAPILRSLGGSGARGGAALAPRPVKPRRQFRWGFRFLPCSGKSLAWEWMNSDQCSVIGDQLTRS